MKYLTVIILTLILILTAGAQTPGLTGFNPSASSASGQLLSNAIVDMKGSPDFGALFLATGKGLSRFQVSIQQISLGQYIFTDSTWTSYTREQNLGKGGVSGLDVRNGMVWLATAFDTTTSLGHFTAGGGISWTADPDTGWAWMPQPTDNPGDTTVGTPTTTNIQNITYDIAITDTAVWIASFGGGLRKYSLTSGQWFNIPPDDNPFDAYAHYNHRAFAVIAPESLLFAGTASGINKSADGGLSWVNYAHPDDWLSGNFVTALAYQHTAEKDIVWAATWPTDKYTTEYHSVSKSENWGLSWSVCHGLDGQLTHNFAFQDSIVYAATDEGVWKSADYGETWYLIPQIVGDNNNYTIYEPEAYCAGDFAGQLWIGTSEGLASTPDYGNTWWVYQAFVSTAQSGEPDTYAYPNPFSPARTEVVRLQYHLTAPSYITVKIYDFALDYVSTVCQGKYISTPGDYYEVWDGENSSGDIVANGVYFYKLEKSGQGTAWWKIVVLD